MILKLRTVDIGWRYIPVEPKGFKIRRLTKEQWRYVQENRDNFWINVDLDHENKILASTEWSSVYLVDVYGVESIYTNDIIFLLNDNGKTVEKII